MLGIEEQRVKIYNIYSIESIESNRPQSRKDKLIQSAQREMVRIKIRL